MSYFSVPTVTRSLDDNSFLLAFNSIDNIKPIINNSLFNYISRVKGFIEPHISQWDTIKKYTNTYEYIHTPVPVTKQSVCKYKPISRSYFKMVEMFNNFNIGDNFSSNNINSFHLAEGPGGFIEAMATTRNNSNDKYYGMTLIEPTNNNVPGWKKSERVLSKYPNITVETGIDSRGDLYNKDNLEYCYKKYANTMDLVTGDGGFDFSIDFNKQEAFAIRLIFSQISFAITLQKPGGTFILKIFDMFLESTIELVYLLSTLYKNVIITKPYTSRTANSERYIICKNFKLSSSEKPYKKFHEIFKILSKIDMSKNYISKFFNFKVPYYFINRIEECNAILGQQQIENINYTISIIENKKYADKIEQIKRNNIHKCIAWCVKHGLAYNKNIGVTNIFLADNINLSPTDMSPNENNDDLTNRVSERENKFKTNTFLSRKYNYNITEESVDISNDII